MRRFTKSFWSAVLDKLAGIQMLDVHFPTTDGRKLILSRYTEPIGYRYAWRSEMPRSRANLIAASATLQNPFDVALDSGKMSPARRACARPSDAGWRTVGAGNIQGWHDLAGRH